MGPYGSSGYGSATSVSIGSRSARVACRKMIRGDVANVCLIFGIMGEIASKFPSMSAYTSQGLETLSKEQALEFMGECSAKKLVHSVWTTRCLTWERSVTAATLNARGFGRN